MFHRLLRYVGFAAPATGAAAEAVLDATFAAARASNPQLWAKPSDHIPTRQAKFEEFCLHLASRLPTAPAARRAVLEAAIARLEVGLREASVGDLGVAKEIRTLAAALHGRLKSYEKHLNNQDFSAFQAAARRHGLAPASIAAAWPPGNASPTQNRKKTLPKPAKPVTRRLISGN
ncbi:MAG: hypothetical protein INF43_00165 [Alphaproteobacteria bacterium]|jgi:hypothetical protein|nr:hypothetical protein [Alphaproteobacteria bacterium]